MNWSYKIALADRLLISEKNIYPYYQDEEIAELEKLLTWWIVELAIVDFDAETLRQLDEGQ